MGIDFFGEKSRRKKKQQAKNNNSTVFFFVSVSIWRRKDWAGKKSAVFRQDFFLSFAPALVHMAGLVEFSVVLSSGCHTASLSAELNAFLYFLFLKFPSRTAAGKGKFVRFHFPFLFTFLSVTLLSPA